MSQSTIHPALDSRILALLIQTMDDAVVVLDATGRIIFFNAGAVKMFGHAAQEMLGQPLDPLLPESARHAHQTAFSAFLTGEEPSRAMAFRSPVQARRANGEVFPVAATIVRLRSEHGDIGAAILRDVSEQQRAETELRRLSSTDALTGLCNRRCLLDRAQKEIAQAERHTQPLSMLVFDMDHFKSVNDRLGHAEGDRVLVRIADCLRAELRQGDSAGRLGGEEFAVVLPQTSLRQAGEAAERVRRRLEACGEAQPPLATVSAGAAQLRAGEQLDDLLRRADRALYQAKNQGRNRVCLEE